MSWFLSFFKIDPGPSSLRLSWVSELISDQFELNIFINLICIRGKLFIGVRFMLIGWFFELLQPHRLRVVWYLSHLVQKGNIILFSFPFLIQEDIRFLEFIAPPMFLNRNRKSFPQPIQQLISPFFPHITLFNECFDNIHKGFINNWIFHQDKLCIRNRLTWH